MVALNYVILAKLELQLPKFSSLDGIRLVLATDMDILCCIWKVKMKQQSYVYALKVGIHCQAPKHLLAHLFGLGQH